MLFIGLGYAVLAISYLIIETRHTLRQKSFGMLSCARYMYAFIYGILPATICLQGESGRWTIDFSATGQMQLFVILLLSLIGFAALSLGYKVAKPARVKKDQAMPTQPIILGATVILAIGWISFYLWTRAFGGISNFIQNADAVRANYSTVYNPLAFLEKVTRILQFAAFIFVPYFFQVKGVKKIPIGVMAVLAAAGGIGFILATDSRTNAGFFVLAIYFIMMEYRLKVRGVSIKRALVETGIIAVIAFLIVILSEAVMEYIRFGTLMQTDTADSATTITNEFGFILQTQQHILKSWMNGGYQLQLGNDLVNALTAWIPSSFLPFKLPDTIWTYNTQLIAGGVGGTIPTDMISASIYQIGILGPAIIPFLYGMAVKKIETKLERTQYNLFYSATKYAICLMVLHSIGYFQLYSFAQTAFYILASYIIVKFVEHIGIKPKAIGGNGE